MTAPSLGGGDTPFLPSDLKGLGPNEVAERVQRGQVNRTPKSDWADYRDIVFRNLFTLFNALILPAAVALFVLGEYKGAWAVSGMGLINLVIGLVQEVRAKRHLDRLAILVETKARVLRDGQSHSIPAGDVVLDDIVLLTAGEPVIADGQLVAARFLEIDEALLTGESDPVPRKTGERLLSGSFCVAGDGAYRAEKVGPQAFAQETSARARQYSYSASPLQRTIDRLIIVLTATAGALGLLYVGFHLAGRSSAEEMWQQVAATVTSMVPQGLVLMTTLAFTLGAVRMASRGALVQRLSAVESMAEIDVLCMDKTGTLTTSRLKLDQVRSLADDLDEAEVRDRLYQFARATVDQQNKTVQALLAGLDDSLHPPATLIDQLPFKSQNRYSAVRVRTTSKGQHLLALGAFEALKPLLLPETIRRAEAEWRELLGTGLRLLLFAEAVPANGGELPTLGDSLQGATLRPLALVGLADELRPDAGRVMEDLAGQGIRFKIISGDNPETVRAAVGHLNLPLAREPVATGDELAKASPEERDKLLVERSVFGRVSPQQKLDLVKSLQRQGNHVAMTGDGVNDVLSIKTADLGIAMGEGTSAAKTVAGLVLESNHFELLPATLDEGRTILRNLRRAGKLFLVKNVYTLLLIVGALGVFGLAFPYLPLQVTLLNALTIGVPAFLITLGRAKAPAVKSHYLSEVGWFAVTTGGIVGAAGLVVMLISKYWLDDGEQTQRTLLLSVLVLLGLGSLFRALTDREKDLMIEDLPLWCWTAAAVLLYLIAMYWDVTSRLFDLTQLDMDQWGLVLAVAGPALLACKLLDWLVPKIGAGRASKGMG